MDFSFSIKNIFDDKIDIMLFYFRVTKYTSTINAKKDNTTKRNAPQQVWQFLMQVP